MSGEKKSLYRLEDAARLYREVTLAMDALGLRGNDSIDQLISDLGGEVLEAALREGSHE